MIHDEKISAPTTPKAVTPTTPKSNTTTPRKQQQESPTNFSFNDSDRNNNAGVTNNKWSPPAVKQQHERTPSPKTNGYHDHHQPEYQLEEPIIHQTVEDTVEAGPPSPTPEIVEESEKFNLEEGLGKAKYTFRAESDTELSFRKVKHTKYKRLNQAVTNFFVRSYN